MTDQSCPVCSQRFAQEDVIPINGTPDQQTQLRAQLPFRKAAKPKKPPKRKAVHEQPGALPQASSDKAQKVSGVGPGSKPQDSTNPST